jgi:hypothetical protein
MQHDTTTPDTTISAEEAAILGRFAERATQAASVARTDDANYMFLMFL